MVFMAGGAAAETKTTIDSLVELLKRRGKMDLNSISTALGVDTNIVENWAKVLEKGNIVKITYEVGKMFVTPSNMTAEQEANARATTEAKSAALTAENASQMLSLDKLAETLSSVKTSVVMAEKAESTEIPEVRKALAELNNIYSTVEQRNKGLEQMAKRAEEIYNQINKRAEELSGKVNTAGGDSAAKGIADARQAAADMTKEVASIDAEVSSIGKRANESIEQVRSNAVAQMKEIEKQIEQNRREVAAKMADYSRQMAATEKQLREQAKAIGSILAEVNDFAKERERQARKLRDIRVEFNNYYVKMSNEMRVSRDSTAAISKDLIEKVEKMKAAFGEATRIDDTITMAKSQIEELEKEIAAARQDVSDTAAQLRALDSMSNMTTEQKVNMISKIEGRAKNAASKLSKMKDKAAAADAAVKKVTKGK